MLTPSHRHCVIHIWWLLFFSFFLLTACLVNTTDFFQNKEKKSCRRNLNFHPNFLFRIKYKIIDVQIQSQIEQLKGNGPKCYSEMNFSSSGNEHLTKCMFLIFSNCGPDHFSFFLSFHCLPAVPRLCSVCALQFLASWLPTMHMAANFADHK